AQVHAIARTDLAVPSGRVLDQHALERDVVELALPHRFVRVQLHGAVEVKALEAAAFVGLGFVLDHAWILHSGAAAIKARASRRVPARSGCRRTRAAAGSCRPGSCAPRGGRANRGASARTAARRTRSRPRSTAPSCATDAARTGWRRTTSRSGWRR